MRASERTERRETPQPSAQSRSDFESALRSKQSKHDGDDDAQDDERGKSPAENTNPLAAFAPLGALRGQSDETPVSAPRALPQQSGTQMKMEAALNANVAPTITEVGANDPAALWEASVRDPNSIPLDVKVLRGERIGPEANAAMTVSVRSSGVNADVLARHASKLDERLKKRGVDGMHVRVEGESEGE